jgi:chemotaxis protein methyltransferase CheR
LFSTSVQIFVRLNRGFNYSILATDICTEVLNKGLAARYPDVMIDPIPEEMRRRYVMLSRNPKHHEFRIVPQLRSKVSFFQLNLMDERYLFDRDFDMIFCRNILIYFDRATQADVLMRLCGHLRPGGYLFLGHSESVTGLKLPLKMAANTIFQRR